MKGLVSFSIALLFAVTAQAQTVFVHADKSLNKDLSKYQTFSWELTETTVDPAKSPQGNSSFRQLVRNAVNEELEGRGYTVDKTAPDLLVSFQIFNAPVSMKAFTGYAVAQGEEFYEPKDTTSFKLQSGTLYVNLIDAKTSEVVWRGYTSGLLNSDTATWREDKVAEAVNLLFQGYKNRGDRYSSVSW